MAAAPDPAKAAYLAICPDPSSNPSHHITDSNGRAFYYVKFGDGANNLSAYTRANPDFAHVENPGSEDYLYRIKNPGTGREEMVRLGKYLEWLLLVAFDKAHGGRSEWHKVTPKAGKMTIAQLAQKLVSLMRDYPTVNMDPHVIPPGGGKNELEKFCDKVWAVLKDCD